MKFIVTGLTALMLLFTARAHADAGWNDFLKEVTKPPSALPNGSPCTGARQVGYSDTKRVAGGRIASESYREQVVQAHTRVTCYASWRVGDGFVQKTTTTTPQPPQPSQETPTTSTPAPQAQEVESIDNEGDFQ